MADPSKPVISYSYTGFQQEQQDNPFPGTQLDADLARLVQSADATIDALKDVRRADGALKNGIVTNESLSTDVTIGVQAATDWATGTAYAVNNTVYHDDALYRCLVAHTSGTFATDLAADKWEAIADFSELTTDAAASASAAATSATTASNKADAAASSATTASTKADEAAASATTASTKASEASTSATAAADSAGDAEQWAIRPEDSPVPIADGGDGATTFSALHWAAKSEEHAAKIPTVQAGDAGKQIFVKADETGYELGLRNVRFDAAQSLTGPQKAQARINVGMDDTTAAPNVGDMWRWNGTVWVPAVAREVLTANRTYFVNPSTGSDSNDGLSSGAAFATIQKALDVIVETLDLGGYDAVVQVADGTATNAVKLSAPQTGPGNIIVQGNAANPENVIVSVTSNHCFWADGAGVRLTVKDLEVRTTTSGNGLLAQNQSLIEYTNVRFGSCATAHMSSTSYAVIRATGNYSIVGAAPIHHTLTGGYIEVIGRTVTISGTPAFSNAYAFTQSLAHLRNSSCTFSGSATGKRYQANTNSVIQTFGGGATYFPGDSAGADDGTGVYA